MTRPGDLVQDGVGGEVRVVVWARGAGEVIDEVSRACTSFRGSSSERCALYGGKKYEHGRKATSRSQKE